MEDIVIQLEKNEFFSEIDGNRIRELISNIRYSIKLYKKGEVIANEEDECNSLGLVLEGIIEIERIYPSGKQIVLKRLSKGNVFGEALIFSRESNYPSTVIAFTECSILYIKKEDILKLCTMEEKILGNFISALSNKILMLNSKIKSISFKSVKHKVINFILEEIKEQNTSIITLNESKEEIAEVIGIPRPSLSRELMNLRNMNYIEFDRNTIKILNIEGLEEELFD